MTDPLAPYPPMMSISDLAHFLGCGRETAAREMQRMPFVSIGTGKKNRLRRVSKEHVRARYKLPEPRPDRLRIVR